MFLMSCQMSFKTQKTWSRCQKRVELPWVRSLTQQMKNNQETNFVEPAYVLLWLFLSGSTVALLLIGAERFSETLAVSTMLFTSFFYLLLLIQDLDKPFDYNGKSSVDVDLSILKQMRDRLNTSVKRCSTNLSL
jgi:hypothetical protein